MSHVVTIMRRATEAVAALLMLLMFAPFIIQVAIPYGAHLDSLVAAIPFLDPTRFGWTLEFCLALWVWLVFWGNAFVVRKEDHVTFDILAMSVPPGIRRVFLIVTGLAIGIGLLASIGPTWGRFAILRLKQTATLSDLLGSWIRMRDIYSIYTVFLVSVGLRSLWSAFLAMRHRDSGSSPPTGEAGP